MNDERNRLLFSLTCGSIAQSLVENPFVVYHQMRVRNHKMGMFNTFITNPRRIMDGFYVRILGSLVRKTCENTVFVNSPFQSLHLSAIFSAILSSPVVCPLKMIEKQKRLSRNVSILDILKYNPLSLFRGIGLIMLHSCISITLRLVEQPRIKEIISPTLVHCPSSSLISSIIVSSFYIFLTNPLSRLEIIIQTSNALGRRVRINEAIKVISREGISGVFKGQGVSLLGASCSLFAFHEFKIRSEMIFFSKI